jgi:hypothetical protein
MNDQSQHLLQSIKGPVIMITIGVLFAADRFTGYHFHQTWPVLLIVIGVMQLLAGRRRRPEYYPPPPPTGSGQTPYAPPAQSYPPAAPPSTGTTHEEPRS